MDKILEIDKSWFVWLNSWHTPFWDSFFLLYTNSKSWIPVILLMIFLLFKNYPWKTALTYILLIGAAVGLSDYIASGLFKPYFERLRPCLDFPNEMVTVGNCGGKYSFASSHAANSFALFMGFSLALKNLKWVFWGLLFWAVLMAYSRIYLGVHFPGDVIVGALIGMFSSQLFFYLYQKIVRK